MTRFLPEALMLILFTYSGILLVDAQREKDQSLEQSRLLQQVHH